MARLNLTLDEDTLQRLNRHTKRAGKPRARLATEILREGLARREALDARRKLAAEYAAGRRDVRAVLRDMEAAQWELLDEDDA